MTLRERFRIWRVRRRGLLRFYDAQDPVWSRVVAELRTGKKLTHWMWFIFPQPLGLGASVNSRIYGLTREEAEAYYDNDFLRQRLVACTSMVLEWVRRGHTLREILGPVDVQKFQSCMELFASVDPRDRTVFAVTLRVIESRTRRVRTGGCRLCASGSATVRSTSAR